MCSGLLFHPTRSVISPTQPAGWLAGDSCVMETMQSFDELFDAEFPRLVRSLGVAFGVEGAADAVQEAFLRADRRWRHVRRLDDPAAWVRRVALNLLLNARRDRVRRTEILASIRAVPTERLDAELIDLRAAIAALPDQMRLSVCLHYLADLPVADVADALGVSTGTVKSNLHDARRRLRPSLEERS